jgi:hypothetical protein
MEEARMAIISIKITPGEPPTVKPDPAYIGANDEVEWKCADGSFTVFFKSEKPFKDWAFYPGHSRSGKPIVGANNSKIYSYSVACGPLRADPGIIIKP